MKGIIAILLLFIVSVSCVTTRQLSIEIPVPSPRELPKEIQSLTIVSRSVDNRHTNLDTESLQKLFLDKNFKLDTVIYDFLSVDTTLKVIGELLYESGRFDFVIPENRFLPFQRNAFITTEMSWTEARELCETFQTDAVLSLDHFATRVASNLKKEDFFNPSSGGIVSAFVAEMNIYFEALIRVYDPSTEKILFREFYRDTLFWTNLGGSGREVLNRFTPVKAGLVETGIAVAIDFTDKIATNWRNEQRNYFVKGNSNFQQANSFIENGDYDTAISLWNKTADETKKKSLKSKAQFNLAVGYELRGEIDKAIALALDSYSTQYRLVTYEYLEILKRRRNELKKLQQ